MKPLIDADILRYEIGFSGEIKGEGGEQVVLDFERVAKLLDRKIELICEEVDATEPPTLYLTGDQMEWDLYTKRHSLDPIPVEPNFRKAVAVTKPYKGTRKSDKPYHFKNITAYMIGTYDCKISNGLEADDDMCIEQCYNLEMLWKKGPSHGQDTVICSRDKDLRMCDGWHYSWECGRQPSIGPVHVVDLGWLEKRPDGKVIGFGEKFFYYQMLTGDTVDNISGLPSWGPAKSFKTLDTNFTSKRDMYELISGMYKSAMGDDWLEYFKEQANLLWMVRQLDKDGNPVMFKPPKKES